VGKKGFVEGYVLAWFVIVLVLAIIMGFVQQPIIVPKCIHWFLLALLAYRLFDILQAWLSVFIRPPYIVASPVRSLYLAIVNYIEIIIIFTIMAYLLGQYFTPPIGHICQSLRYSVGIMSFVDHQYEPLGICGYSLFYSQIAFSLAFILIVIQRIMSLFRGNH